MSQISVINPLPIRFPATWPAVAGDHMDIDVWPGGWAFRDSTSSYRFAKLNEYDQSVWLSTFWKMAATLQAEATHA